MKVLCDVHIAYKIKHFFESHGIEAMHVNFILDRWHSKDNDIARFADTGDMVLISKDSDFQDSHFLKNTPQKLLKISLGNLSTKQVIALLEAHLGFLETRFDAGDCFIEISLDYVRVIAGR